MISQYTEKPSRIQFEFDHCTICIIYEIYNKAGIFRKVLILLDYNKICAVGYYYYYYYQRSAN